LGSRSGFTAVHAPPSHLLWSLNELLALDAANDALGAARKAKSATAAATPIFLTMVIPPFRVGQECPVAFTHVVSIYIYTRASLRGPDDRSSSFLAIFTDVHFDERSFMKLKRPSSSRGWPQKRLSVMFIGGILMEIGVFIPSGSSFDNQIPDGHQRHANAWRVRGGLCWTRVCY